MGKSHFKRYVASFLGLNLFKQGKILGEILYNSSFYMKGSKYSSKEFIVFPNHIFFPCIRPLFIGYLGYYVFAETSQFIFQPFNFKLNEVDETILDSCPYSFLESGDGSAGI